MPVAAKEEKTMADYRALPEGAPYQLIEGELVLTPSPNYFHQKIAARLSFAFMKFLEGRDLGEIIFAPMDVHLAQTEAYQPDILFISNERSGIIEERVEGAPDLVVEILSPTTGYYDLTHKKRVYRETGVKEYWIVDPMEETVDVLWNEGEAFETESRARIEGTVFSRLLDGFSIELNDLFPARAAE